MSAPSSSWQSDDNLMNHQPSPISTAILSAQQWETLDFEDIEKELANKLSDDDIYAILKCINAQDVLKRLSLAGCINISGMGLEPLRGSVVLEQIDLSRTDIRDPAWNSNSYHLNPRISALSEEIVVNLLDSIVNKDGCSLKYILFPRMWRDGAFVSLSIRDFRARYNQMHNNRMLKCSKCSVSMGDELEWLVGRDTRVTHRFKDSCQKNTCYSCLKPFCAGCLIDDDESSFPEFLQLCGTCDRDYCADCSPTLACSTPGCGDGGDGLTCSACMATCGSCKKKVCKDFCFHFCDGCGRGACRSCMHYNECSGNNCGKAHCHDCFDGEEYNVHYCEGCNATICFDCELANKEIGSGLYCENLDRELATFRGYNASGEDSENSGEDSESSQDTDEEVS